MDVEAVFQVTVGEEFQHFSARQIRDALQRGLDSLFEDDDDQVAELVSAEPGTWTDVATRWVSDLPWPQSEVAQAAARSELGVISRAEVLRIVHKKNKTQQSLRGFTKPYARIAAQLQAANLLDPTLNPKSAMEPIYAGSSTAASFRLHPKLAKALRRR